MSSWSDMIKNKSTDVKKKQVKSTLNKPNKTNDYTDNEIYRTYGLKNVEEEYDYKYSDRIGEIIVEFRDLLSNYKAYDISNKFGNNLYNFIKYHSNNYNRFLI